MVEWPEYEFDPEKAERDVEMWSRRERHQLERYWRGLTTEQFFVAGRLLAQIVDACDSDIEAQMAMGLIGWDIANHPHSLGFHKDTSRPLGKHYIIPQFPVGGCRLDFLLCDSANNKRCCVAIECDGRNFHTSEAQKDRDRKRDRFLNSQGFTVVRFIGKDITFDPSWCAMKAYSALSRQKLSGKLASEAYFDDRLHDDDLDDRRLQDVFDEQDMRIRDELFR